MSCTQSGNSPSEVILFENYGEFHVAVLENGGESVRTFDSLVYAESYADGQRMRLGLRSVTRSDVPKLDYALPA